MSDLYFDSFSDTELVDVSEREGTGLVSAYIATLGVMNRNKRFIALDAVKDEFSVVVSDYNHSSAINPFIEGRPPVAAGTVYKDGRRLLLKDAVYPMDVDRSRDAFKMLQVTKSAVDWSIAYTPFEADRRSDGLYISKMRAYETSPVGMGASPNTRTFKTRRDFQDYLDALGVQIDVEDDEGQDEVVTTSGGGKVFVSKTELKIRGILR